MVASSSNNTIIVVLRSITSSSSVLFGHKIESTSARAVAVENQCSSPEIAPEEQNSCARAQKRARTPKNEPDSLASKTEIKTGNRCICARHC